MRIPVKDLGTIIEAAQKTTALAAFTINKLAQATMAERKDVGLTGDDVVLLIQTSKLQGMIATAYGALEAIWQELQTIPTTAAAAEAFAAADKAGEQTCTHCNKVTVPTPAGRCSGCDHPMRVVQ